MEPYTKHQMGRHTSNLMGVGLTFLIALGGMVAARLPGLTYIGPLGCSILLAILYRQFFGYPAALKTGIQFSAKKLLRIAIVLFGLKLDMAILLHDGLSLLLRGAFTILLAIALTLLLAKWFKAGTTVSLLVAIGTGVCGAAAIAAVSPIVDAEEDETAISVGMIALVGTVFSIAYTLLLPFLPLTPEQYGSWSGLSLHELAHVALAAAPAGEDALALALLAKLGRVFLLIPLCFGLMVIVKRRNRSSQGGMVAFPWFLLGFVAMSLIGSYVLGDVIPVGAGFAGAMSTLTSFLLAAAMAGLGLNVSIAEIRKKALRPLAAMTVASLLLSVVVYVLV